MHLKQEAQHQLGSETNLEQRRQQTPTGVLHPGARLILTSAFARKRLFSRVPAGFSHFKPVFFSLSSRLLQI